MRGPSISPAFTPSRAATSLYPAAPTLRIVVNPARSVSRVFFHILGSNRFLPCGTPEGAPAHSVEIGPTPDLIGITP
jgi:hypothetical protein